MATTQEHREAERVVASLSARLGDAAGLTRDLSAKGIFFELEHFRCDASEIGFCVELETPTGKFLLQGTGSVVRTERLGRRTGVAVQVTDSLLTVPC